MTPERFGELLRRPRLLSGQSATELEELIAAYPWSGPLRRLRYAKALIDGDEADTERWRGRAKPFLLQGFVAEQAEHLLRANPARAEAHFDFLAEESAAVGTSVALGNSTTSPDERSAEVGVSSAGVVEAAAAAVETVDWYLHVQGFVMDPTRPQPVPREQFASYRAQRERAQRGGRWRDLLDLTGAQPRAKDKRKRKRRKHEDAVEQPVAASETLADLLAAQGHTEQAIRMYERLALRYPGKNDNFAARIAELRQETQA